MTGVQTCALPIYLTGTHAIFAVAEHPKGAHPLIQSDWRVFKDRSHLEAELLFAALAKPDAAGADERVILRAAAWARNNAVRPAKIERILKAAVRIAEVNNRFLKCLGRFHINIMRLFSLCVKYIVTKMNINFAPARGVVREKGWS